MKIRRTLRTAAIIALAVVAVSDVRADDDPPAPIVTATISVASYDKVKDLSDLVGMPLPPGLTPDGIEHTLPFIGVGKFRVDAPMGMAFLFGKNLSDEEQGFFVLPLMAGGAPLTDIPDATTTDQPDTIVAGNGMPFRRTADYLMFGGTVPTTSKYDTAKITDLYKPKKSRDGKTVTPLFRCDVDVKGMKSVDPDKLNDFLEKNTKDHPQTAGEKMGSDWVIGYIKTGVDRFDLDVDQVGDDHLSVSTRIAPLHADSTSVDKPGLPDDCLLRADLRLPAELLQKLYDIGSADEKESPQDRAVLKMFSKLLVGKTESLGLADDGGDPVVYEVVQTAEKTDLAKSVRGFVEDSNKAAKNGAVKTELTEYTAPDGTVIQRMSGSSPNADGSKFYIDTFARGNSVFVSFSPNDHHLVEKLAGLKSAGKFDDVASGWVKPKESSKLLKKLADEQNIPPEVVKLIGQLGDDPLQWHADNDGDGLRITVEFPREILRNLGPALGAGN